MHTETHSIAPSAPDVSPERRAEDIRAFINKASGHRQVLLHVLTLCMAPRTAPELDAETIAFMKGQVILQPPSAFRQWLKEIGGLRADTVGEGEAAQDSWLMTPAGRIALASLNLSRELMDLLDDMPAHRQTYVKILRFCETPRTREEIEKHLDGDPAIDPPKSYPSTFIAPLEDVGAIRWADKWTTTDVGRQACV